MLRDLRYGVRALLQAKGWTGVVVLSLALGIGATAAIFSAINNLLLQKLPVRNPDTLVRLRVAGKNDMVTNSSDYGSSQPIDGQNVRTTFSYPMFLELRDANRTMTDLFACAPSGRMNVVVDGTADVATSFVSSGNYYSVLGVTAVLGRTITPADDQPAAPPVAVISHRFWKSRFAGDPTVVGKIIRIANIPITIVGVLPPQFIGVQRTIAEASDVGLPLVLTSQLNNELSADQQRLKQPTYWWLQIMGRLKPGVTAAQVRGNLAGVFQHEAQAGLGAYLASLPDEKRLTSDNQNRAAVPNLVVDAGARGLFDPTPADVLAVRILSVVVVLVLLIVCANVANLLLSRSSVRQKEVSIRLSMGATRGRLIRQLLTESVLLASMGGALGILVGNWGTRLLPRALGQFHPLDWRVLVFVLAVTTSTGIVFGIAPALRATSVDLTSALNENSRSMARSRGALSKVLLIAQVAISLMLLIGAGLFLRTVQNLRRENVGFNPQNLVVFQVNPRLIQYDPGSFSALYQRIIDRLEAVPGLRAVTFSHVGLLAGSENSTNIFVQGRAYPPGRANNNNNIDRLVVWDNFFETMGMPLLAGRGFRAADDQGAPKVAVINESAARKYFPNENPLGRRFGSNRETSGQIEIVGVLRDAKYVNVRDPAPPTMYVPYLQNSSVSAVFEVRIAGDPAAAMEGIRRAV
jgi:predicted permease